MHPVCHVEEHILHGSHRPGTRCSGSGELLYVSQVDRWARVTRLFRSPGKRNGSVYSTKAISGAVAADVPQHIETLTRRGPRRPALEFAVIYASFR